MRDNPAIVWEMYQSLEKEFLNYLEYVPLTPQHYEVWSYPLVNLLNNTGSSVDSFCKNAIFCDSLNDYQTIDEIRIDGRQHNMKTYRDIFENRSKISRKQIFELKNSTSFFPFQEWGEERPPDWWIRYTDIKHDRFRNKGRATLKATMEALGGLFTLFLTHRETLEVLIDQNVVFSQHPKEFCKRLLSLGEPITRNSASRIYAKTSLFGYVFDVAAYPNDADNKIRVLSPSYPGFG